MAKKNKAATTVAIDVSPQAADAIIADQQKKGIRAGLVANWNEHGWTPELRESAHALAVQLTQAKALPVADGYDTNFGAMIRAKAFVRVINGGPSSADVKAEKAAKAAAKAPVAAVAQTPVPVQTPAGVAAKIGFRPRGGTKKVATPALTEPGAQHAQGVGGLSEAELKAGIETLVTEARRRGMA